MLLIGSHVNYNSKTQLLGALRQALSMNETTFMFYTGAPQNTMRSKVDSKLVEESLKELQENNIDINKIIVHAPYIINLANTEKYVFAVNFLKQEISRCESLHIKYMVLHPGSHVGLGVDKGIENIISGLNEVLENSTVTILLETMAGKGTEIGRNFEELKKIIDGINRKDLIGVCLDTCHLNDAGYDISNFDERTIRYLEDANRSHKRLLEVTDSFTPLYRRDLRKKSSYCNLLDCVRNSVRLIKAKKISSDVQFIYNIGKDIVVQMNEGELQTILINLFDNACYWIKESKTDDKRIVIETENEKNGRITIVVSDTGLGVEPENAEKIFTPGITAKPKGVGMGLVIVTELVNAYDGKAGLRYPGNLHGATFVFDVPMKRGESQ